MEQEGRMFGRANYKGPSTSQLEDELKAEHVETTDRVKAMREQLKKIDTQIKASQIKANQADDADEPSSFAEEGKPRHEWKGWNVPDFKKEVEKGMEQEGRMFGRANYKGPSTSQLEDELKAEHVETTDRVKAMRE